MELRQRRSLNAEAAPASSPFVEKLKALDSYPKTLDDFKERTSSGAAVSLVSCAVILMLVVSELRSFWTPVVVDHLYVDHTISKRIRINVNITFPSMACPGLNLVAMDVAGEQQIDVVNNIVKTRLSLSGERIGREEDEGVLRRKNRGQCGNCYLQHADNPSFVVPQSRGGIKRCCNTCDDVKSTYEKIVKEDPGYRTQVKWDEHPLCLHEAVMVDPARLKDIKEGCNLFGFLEVSKVAGNFHVAPGKAFQSAAGQLVHEFKPFDTHFYNISHVIHEVYFGAHYPNRVNPLDDSVARLSNGSGVFQYFIKVVPTTYEYASGKVLDTCQYSVTDQFKSAHDPSKGFVLPGVFFIYDISPVMVKFTEKRTTFSYFLTSLIAIVGGVFTVAGIVDAMIYQVGGAISGKSKDGLFG